MSYISKIKAAGMSDFATQIVNAFMWTTNFPNRTLRKSEQRNERRRRDEKNEDSAVCWLGNNRSS
jgi:hypothetical protein